MKINITTIGSRPGEWRVEARDVNGEAGTEITTFSGPSAETRARDYAEWKYGNHLRIKVVDLARYQPL